MSNRGSIEPASTLQDSMDRTEWFNSEMLGRLPPKTAAGKAWPSISIVTPSYNQGPYIEDTIRSVLCQDYPNLEYILMDGGSKDETVGIIRRYESKLAYWSSEKDEGQTDAIDKGFRRATGEIMAYLNSDDVYLPYTFELIGKLFVEFPEVDWITAHSSFLVDGKVVSPRRRHVDAFNQKLMRLGFNTPWFLGIPQQVSTFWRRSLYEKAGAFMKKELCHGMAEDLWYRMAAHSAPVFLPATVAMMRIHMEQKSYGKGPASLFGEIENGHYGFLPLSMRRWLVRGMRAAGVRGIIRRLAYDGKARQFNWNSEKRAWDMIEKLAF
jgi:glycosyltransferase involved in cell wall biosynthesis